MFDTHSSRHDAPPTDPCDGRRARPLRPNGWHALLLGVLSGCAAPSPPEQETPRRAQAPTLQVEARRPLPKGPIPPPLLGRAAADYRLVVKFADVAQVRAEGTGRLRSDTLDALDDVQRIAEESGIRFTPLFDAEPEALDAFAERARAHSGRAQPDLRSLFRVEFTTQDADERHGLAEQLQALEVVEFASFHAAHASPPADILPPTPNLTEFQTYRGALPGMNFDEALALGYDGAGIRVSDIEYAWTLTHEELEDADITPEPGAALGTNFADHGTAVLGLLVADAGDYGIDGLCPGVETHVFPQYTPSGVDRAETAVFNALAGSEPGDVVLFEMQIEGFEFVGAPKELDEVFWMLSRVATDAGIVVVAAAGNGNINLDAATFQAYRDRGDSGAIIVGAGEPDSLEPAGFSTHGARVDVQGWGRGVFTTGYGTFAEYGDDPRQRYDEGFGGTSSASALVAAASVLVLDAFAQHDQALSPAQLRQLLVATGTPQDPGVPIGPRVNVGAAVQAVEDDGPPTVVVSSPAGPVVADGPLHNVTFAIEAEDLAGIYAVGLSINGDVLPQRDGAAPFEFVDVAFPEGVWEVVALAEDGLGTIGESEPLTIYVGVEPPEPPEPDTTSSSSGGDVSDGAGTTGPAATTADGGDDSTGAGAGSDGGTSGCRVSTGRAGGSSPWWLLVLFVGCGRARSRVRD